MSVHWVAKRLGDVCHLVNGRAYSKPELLESGKYPVLRVGNFFSNRSWYFSDLELLPEKYCVDGDLLYAWSASFGPRIWNGGKAIYHYHIWKVVPNTTQVLKEFLFYWFEWDKELITRDRGAGTTMIHVTKKSMEARSLRLPPLSEQKRIVAILDEAFAGIDAAIANTEKNLANARELFENQLRSIFSSQEEGWIKTTVGHQLTLQRGFDITKKEQQDGPIPVVSSGGVRSYHSKHMVRGPGVVIGRKGTLGSAYYIEADFWPHDTTLWVKDFNENPPRLVYYFFVGLDVKHLDSGAANPALNRNLVHALPVYWPPPAIQSHLVCVLDKLQSESAKVSKLCESKLEALAELKQSLLHQAFTGELTKEPEKALREAAL